MNFNKDFGQHILKNPLIVKSMIEKVVCKLLWKFEIKIYFYHFSHVGCSETNWYCLGNWTWNGQHDSKTVGSRSKGTLLKVVFLCHFSLLFVLGHCVRSRSKIGRWTAEACSWNVNKQHSIQKLFFIVRMLIFNPCFRPLQHKLKVVVGDVLKSELPFFDVCVANLPYQVINSYILRFLRIFLLKTTEVWFHFRFISDFFSHRI